MRKVSILVFSMSLTTALLALHCGDDDDVKPQDAGTGLDSGPGTDSGGPGTDSGGGSDSGDSGSSTPRTIYGVDDANQLLKFTTTTAGTVTKVNITGVAAIHGIDFRPANGVLYALGGDAKIYTIDTTTGTATVVAGDAGTMTFPVVLDNTATSYGFDFNPVADRIRVHNDKGQNYRLHPANGESVNATTDTMLTYEDGGAVASVVATGYTNSVNPKPAATALYGIDPLEKRLVTFFSKATDAGFPAGNFAGVRPVGPLMVDIESVAGFDIYGGLSDPDGGAGGIDRPLEAYAALRTGGELGLYGIDLTTGKATKLGVIMHDKPLRGIAVQP